MLKSLLRPFLDGVLAGILFNFFGTTMLSYIPPLPMGLSSAVVLGILVLVIDFILREVARI